MTSKISVASKILLISSAILLFISLFVPIWRIDLDAPQYPEGLRLLIWANAIAGDVDIINGLNHYIGMKTLHTEDFIEFKILPYIIVAYALFFLLSAFMGRKRLLTISFWAFVAFGVIAMADFWKWEYDYGHNLDPNAAIKVPGMAYQPPLIGFKQLLNFGAYSIPDIGGWMILGAGLLLLTAVLKENNVFQKFRRKRAQRSMSLLLVFLGISLAGCSPDGPVPIRLNQDPCDFCRMTIADGRFASEIITQKGRVFKFDDLHCLSAYIKEQAPEIKQVYINDYSQNNKLIDATAAFFVQSEAINSPMGGKTAAFEDQTAARQFANKLETSLLNWDTVLKRK